MIRFLFLYILFLLFNCSSFGSIPTKSNSNPSHDTGCSEVKGPSWFLCMEKLQATWQKIESSKATITILSKDREGKYVHLKKRICWSEYFCRDFEEIVYAPTFFQRLKVTLSTVLISVCIGFLIGISF
ncbi:hypothetical protein LEP1GSC151_5846 [Leptospira interrogans serovar Grippotyphosa str. LT2186]|uniref:Uncharacterized protein n=2 Tax=Leptospira interrogans TaxID=173 RepID=A0A0E2DAF0_LEPIR|nr:hypothetical protein [Leptospira interrogans]EKR47611.1 hypothetical protein LEP1GSC097_0453 [Leptospira interrogans serovar Grippotyphosa str. UI 08368]EKR56443.1 hypothetical protein LEP1GSC105_4290 [Leptospira interrogans str. UI 12758]EMG09975.1 hypothetical protein LEP1GSC151_5846 [Leptospira interrogans serovar Grippotyphosa str. LT2186]EMN83342.1 hypothetical protein LEP1GSC107_0792 [Leptospira interrogans serovar Grippotyphosa str. UI 12769]